jgi:hypothetical protein
MTPTDIKDEDYHLKYQPELNMIVHARRKLSDLES